MYSNLYIKINLILLNIKIAGEVYIMFNLAKRGGMIEMYSNKELVENANSNLFSEI